jgi:uncharacterized protein YbjT (DUF2867 family)
MILVTGSTGNVGAPLVHALARRGEPVRALLHDPAEADGYEALGVDAVDGTFEDEHSLRKALRGVERLFVLTPAGTDEMATRQVRLAELAREAGVRRIVKLSGIAADETDGPAIARAHRQAERAIEASATAWTHLRPHWFLQNELGHAETIAAEGVFYAPDVGRIAPVDARDVAEAAATVLTEDGHEDRAYTLTGPALVSYDEIAKSLGAVLGREVRWIEVSLDEARASMLAAGYPEVLASGFTEYLARFQRGGVTGRLSPDLPALLGREPRDVETFIRDNSDAYEDALAQPTR